MAVSIRQSRWLGIVALFVATTNTAYASPPSTDTLPIIELHGSPADLGREDAQQLGPEIRTLQDQYLKVFIGSRAQAAAANLLAAAFERQLEPAHRSELAAMAAGTGLPETQAMLAQCFLDLTPMAACSTIALPAEASPDHIARFGRNLEFDSLGVADKYTRLLIVRPDDGRYAFASVGWPGLIGVLSGMNERGLCLANMEVPRDRRLPSALPYTMLYRTVLERCGSVDEAIALLRRTPIQTANNLMLMDATGDRAVVELSPGLGDAAAVVRRAGANTSLISTNHQRGPTDLDTPGRCTRFDYLHDTSAKQFGHIDVAAVEHLLAHVGNANTLQSMVFEPAGRVLYLAAGDDAAHRTFQRIELAKYFELPSSFPSPAGRG